MQPADPMSSALTPGALFAHRFEIERVIGSGGMGTVYRARDVGSGGPVALKLLHQRHAEQAETVARFRSEAQHAAALSHENIAQVFDYGEAADGQPPYLVMELVAGASLETVLEVGPLDATRTMDIVAQAAAGLQVAHAAGMIHRDVKPGNLLLNQSGTVKITDFGLAHTVGSASVKELYESTGMTIVGYAVYLHSKMGTTSNTFQATGFVVNCPLISIFANN